MTSSQRGTPPHAPTPSAPTTPLSSHPGSRPYSSTPPAIHPQQPITTAPSSTQHHQGPQPISPPPLPPQISAAELTLLTEASATSNGTFQCTLCSKQFGYKNGLIRHVRLTHVGEKPYQCNICNRRFGYKHILVEHQNLHFGNRPYACGQCDKRFAARSNLIQHRTVHRRPFNCTLCQKRFDREDQLKKHLFAHPQAAVVVVCSVCNYPASSQTDVRRHMAEAHRGGLSSPGSDDNNDGDGGYNMDPVTNTTPDSSEDHIHPPTTATVNPNPNPVGSRYPVAPAAVDSRGHRIDSICSQLSGYVSHHQHQQQQQHLQQHHQQQQQVGPYHGVVVKKELVDTADEKGPQGLTPPSPRRLAFASEAATASANHRHRLQVSPIVHSGSGFASTDAFLWSPTRRPGSGLGPDLGLKTGDEPPAPSPSSSALPGIHEVFSRRNNGQKLPPFANFMPVPTKANHHHHPHQIPLPDLTLSMLQSPPPATASTAAPPGVVVNPTQQQRPTAQLPPMKATKERASQHPAAAAGTLSIAAGFPSLDDVLSHYIGQGRLFKCQHCNILFSERGMYFLHASLHGLTSPWECSICHKICSDKNEFTLHFVNQQHNS